MRRRNNSPSPCLAGRQALYPDVAEALADKQGGITQGGNSKGKYMRKEIKAVII